MSGTASGYTARKCASASAPVFTAAKLEPAPSWRQKSVQVNEPSGFGSAIIMLSPRGQMWSAFGSMANGACGPLATGGMWSSL